MLDTVTDILIKNGAPISAPEIYRLIADQFPYESAALGARRVKEGIRNNINRFGNDSRFGKTESGNYFIKQ
jgi:hypothetical protein